MSLQSQLIRLARNVGALNADTNAIFEALRAKGVDMRDYSMNQDSRLKHYGYYVHLVKTLN